MTCEDGLLTGDVVSKEKNRGIQVTSDFKWSALCVAVANEARGVFFGFRPLLSCRNVKILIPLYNAFPRPHLKYYVHAWSLFFQKD